MRINWHSNSPWTATGYGNQTRLTVPRLKDLGHHLSITAFYGLQGGLANYGDIRVYPNGHHLYGQDIIGASAQMDQADIIISLMDAWIMEPKRIPAPIKWFPWFPIDCEPIPEIVAEKVVQSAKGITMSKFGQAQAEAAGLDTYYIPHGIDTKVFQPVLRSRERLKWPKDKFIVGMVAANKGIPPRKSFFEQIAAFAALHKQHPDSLLYLHTADGKLGGESVDLIAYCNRLGLDTEYLSNGEPSKDTAVLFADQYTYMIGLPDAYLVDVYNSLDVLMNASMGEGFGIPIVEAQACGCPVIVGDWTSMGELCFSGWKIPKSEATPVYNPYFDAFQWSVTTEAVAERLFKAYEMRGSNEGYKQRARKGALEYDVDLVVEKYWKPILAEIEVSVRATQTAEVTDA